MCNEVVDAGVNLNVHDLSEVFETNKNWKQFTLAQNQEALAILPQLSARLLQLVATVTPPWQWWMRMGPGGDCYPVLAVVDEDGTRW